jgi:hypothetical protein
LRLFCWPEKVDLLFNGELLGEEWMHQSFHTSGRAGRIPM